MSDQTSINCRAIEPIKFGVTNTAPQGTVLLPADIAHEQRAAGRVEFVDGDEGFTPTDPSEGVADIEQSETGAEDVTATPPARKPKGK